MRIPNLAYLRNLPDIGKYLYEAFAAVQQQSTTVEQQVNGNAEGQPAAPPAIDRLQVTGQNGHFNVAIQDNGKVSRGIRYYVEHDTDPNFTNPHIVHLGDSRNANLFLGNQQLYFRAYSAYPASPPSAPAYHGSPLAPSPVRGGGSVGGPAKLASQGSGTGAPGVGLSGPGPLPRRDSSTGVSWIQARGGVSGSSPVTGSTPQELASIGGAGAQVVAGSNLTIVEDNSSILAGKPAAPAENTLYRNSYFGRVWEYHGGAWHYYDAGCGAGAHVLTTGVPPDGPATAWTPANGVAVDCAMDNCTIAAITPLNTQASGGDNPVLRGGAGGAPSAATAATFAGGATNTGNDSDAGVTFLAAGVGSTAALNPHVHPLPTINPPTVANGGLEFGVSCAVWMRR